MVGQGRRKLYPLCLLSSSSTVLIPSRGFYPETYIRRHRIILPAVHVSSPDHDSFCRTCIVKKYVYSLASQPSSRQLPCGRIVENDDDELLRLYLQVTDVVQPQSQPISHPLLHQFLLVNPKIQLTLTCIKSAWRTP